MLAPVLAAALAALAAGAGAVRAEEPPPPPPTATPVPTSAATPAPEPEAPPEEATRSEPDTGATPAGTGGGHRKGGVASRSAAARAAPLYTVLEIVPGKSLSVRAPDGHSVVFDLTKKTKLPSGLTVGGTVTVRAKASGKRRVATEVRIAETPAAPAPPPSN